MSFGKLDVTVLDGKNISLNEKEEYAITVTIPAAKTSSFKVPKMPPSKFSSWSGRAEIEFTKAITQDMVFTLTVAEVHLMDKVVGEGTFCLSELFGQGSRVSQRVQINGKGTSTAVCEVNIDCNWQGSVPEYLGGVTTSGGGGGDAAAAGGALPNSGSSTAGSLTLVPLPNCEGRSYSIRVLLRKCKNLQAKDDNALYDPLVTVTVGQETQKTEYQKQTNEPLFDEELMFMCQSVDSKFWNLPIHIAVMDHRIGFPDKEIGMTQLEMQSVYRTPNHMLAHKWYILRKGGMSTQIMGFLKMTIMVLDALNDPIPEVDDDPEDGEEGEDNLILNLVNTPGAQFEEMYMRCEMFRAEGIPQMDVALGGFTGGKADPYVTLQYGVKKNRTPHLNSTLTPEWNAVAMIPVQVPALVDAFTLQMWDYNTAGSNDVIATTKLSISSLKTPDGLPNMPAQFLNFYGSPRAYMPQITKPKFFQQMDKGAKDGIDFRGRMLCQFRGSRDRECGKDPIVCKPRTTNLVVVVMLQALQFSMLKSGTFTFTVTCGNGIDEKPAKCRNEVKSSEMRGTSSGLGSVYFGEEVRLERRIEVALPPSNVTDPQEFQAFIKKQIPDVILHLWNGSNMYASFRVPATRLLFLPEAIYVCNSMRVVSDPEKLDEGEAPSDPLAQFHVGMFVKGAEPGRVDKSVKNAVEVPLTPEEKALIPITQDIRIQGIPPGAAEKFLLEACIYRAASVPPSDPNGLSDPFVRVSWANGCMQTGVQLENLNPTFDEMIHVYADTKQPFTDIIVELWDWDLIGNNDFLCRARVSVDQAVKKAGEIFWIENFVDNRGKPLQDTKVLASFEVFKNPDKNPEKFLNLPKIKVPKKVGSKETYTAMKIRPGKELLTQPFDVNISLLHLRKMRPFRLLDVKSPSVEVTIANSTVKFEKLAGPNPDINKQAKLTVELPTNPEFWPNLNVSVFDHRALGNKPRVGIATQKLTRLVVDQNAKKELMVSSFDPARKEEAKAKAESDLNDRLQGILTWKMEKFGDPLEQVTPPAPGGDLRANISFELEARKKKDEAAAKKKEAKGKKARTAPTEETSLLAGTTNGEDEGEELGESQNELDEADLALEVVKRKQIEELMPQELRDEPPAKEGSPIDDTPKKPSDIPWNERFDADEHVKPKEFIVSRLGKIHDYLKGNKPGYNKANEGTAEAYFGPFTGDVCQVSLLRGSGKSMSKAGELTFDLVIKKAEDTATECAPTTNDVRKPMKYLLRSYIIACRHLAAVDHSMFGNSSDPFVILSLSTGARGEKEKGAVRLNLKELRKEKTLNPDYYMMHEMNGELPKHNTLTVEVYDYEAIGSDTLIGFTDINLEERWYSTRGYSARREYMEPGYYTEKRQLRDEIGQIQGTIELWIDMFDAKEKIPKPIDITPPPPIEFELRTIVWACRDVELEDMSFSGEAMTDIYIRCWMNGLRHDMQSTDVHYRSLDGSGTFNWRMNFRFLFDPRSKRIMPIAKKASSIASWFRIRREQKKFDPILKLQIFDNNFFPGTDSFIGEASLHLMKLNPALVKRSHSALVAEMLNDMRKSMSSLVCCKCCYKDPGWKDMTLEQRQKIAVDEFKKDQEERNKIFVAEAEEKMKKVKSVGGYSDEQLAQFYQKFLAEARASAKVNAFEAFLPGAKKKKPVDDKNKDGPKEEAPEPGKHLKAVQQLPPTADTAKYWFMTRGPKGSGRVGDVQLSFQLVRIEALEEDEKLAAGLGRAEPQALPDPNRPDSSYFWLTSPFKAALHILWKRYKWYILGLLAILLLALFLYVFLRSGVEIMASKTF